MNFKALKNYLLAGVMTAVPINMDEEQPILQASPEIQAKLSAISDVFLETANKNVIVLSQEDLVTDNPYLQRQMRMAQIMGTRPTALFTGDESLEIIRAIREQYQIAPLLGDSVLPTSWQKQMEDAADISLFVNIFSNEASARHVSIINDPDESCLVISPSLKGQAGQILTMLGHLPSNHYPKINDAITYDDVYQFVMLHEAAHCDQEHPHDVLSEAKDLSSLEREINNNLLRLDMETEADEIALQQMHNVLESQGRPVELAEEIQNATRAARSIGALRMGADIFEGAEFYPKHATYIFDEQPEFDYTGADIFLAIKLTTTLVNSSMGYLHGTLAKQSTNPNLAGKINDGSLLPSLILTPQEAASAGRTVGHELPEIQYGTIKAMLEISDRTPEIDSLSGDEYDYLRTSLTISRQIMRNHLDAMQTYYPTIADSVLAQDSYENLKELGTAALEAAKRLESETATPDASTERDYSSLSPHMQKMIERFEASLTAPKDAMETLVLIRNVVNFYDAFQMMLELEFERDMKELERPAFPPGKVQPIAPPAPNSLD